ncbi:transferrin receptor protein 2 isoform X3 [Strigops habroptila]|uniref:transferrin receptor protein 2 isoform X3 n=1 Tax=Strigops habroptila TaxID=2489341 RepID=UPI0011CED5D8|nr:transferrin receptor protein 2 isoform X3 [Strigops habroptila]
MGGGRELERLRLDPEAFCAWSAPGNATGGLVYGHYGRPQDLALLRARGVPPRGNLLLLRLGRGPPGAKVAAAAGVGAVGVLLYPDPQDTAGPGGDPGLGGDTAVTVHLQEGSGDPYSRGFPSFTGRAPPGPPPGVPPIPAHPISANTAARLLRVLGGPRAPARWGVPSRGLWYRPGPGGRRLRLSVAAGTAPGTLTSVFGALEGRLEPDCYIIVGAQRDSLGPGAAASGVGTALLLELARLFAAMGRDGFQLRRTLLFVSWDGAEFGHLGATEWLEGYPDLLHTKAAAYISLDQAVLGADRLVVKTSPTLVNLIESALSQVESPNEGGKSLLEQVTRPGRGWESDVVSPLPAVTLSAPPSACARTWPAPRPPTSGSTAASTPASWLPRPPSCPPSCPPWSPRSATCCWAAGTTRCRRWRHNWGHEGTAATSACAWPCWPGPCRARPGPWLATPGTGGTSGTAVASGTSGSAGTTGAPGVLGTLGAMGTMGTLGLMGALGTTATLGTMGVPGAMGTRGTMGTMGTMGTLGLTVALGTPWGQRDPHDLGAGPPLWPLLLVRVTRDLGQKRSETGK